MFTTQMNGNIFYSDKSVSRGFTNGLKVVRNHPITDSEIILHIDNVALTSLCSQKQNIKERKSDVTNKMSCLLAVLHSDQKQLSLLSFYKILPTYVEKLVQSSLATNSENEI